MNANTESQSGVMDSIKWSLTFLILVAAVVGNYFYSDVLLLWRVLGVVVAIALAVVIAAQTTKGKATVTFAREARLEVRKVVWPTRQEATHTTLIVLAATVITALVLWGLDGIFVRLVALITGVSI
jgi:preprotein translocase subunit SecE